jgi:hypothetical protein
MKKYEFLNKAVKTVQQMRSLGEYSAFPIDSDRLERYSELELLFRRHYPIDMISHAQVFCILYRD